jgi:hypothetical protein
VDNSLGVELSAIGVWRSEDYYHIVFAILVDNPLDVFLTLRVKRASGRSDKALGQHQYRLGSGAYRARRNRRSLHSITLADYDDFLPFEFHSLLLPAMISEALSQHLFNGFCNLLLVDTIAAQALDFRPIFVEDVAG